MSNLTPEGLEAVSEIAARNGVSREAALTLLDALVAGNGSQAQFHHPDLGGMGQWSQGGMIMIGDMFNQGLKWRVDRLCQDLAALLQSHTPVFSPSRSGVETPGLFPAGSSGNSQWWPADLGAPASVGAQNDTRYAYFPGSRRLLIMREGRMRIYDSGEHQISGVSQQQGGDASMTFTSQFGRVSIDKLAPVSLDGDNSRNAPPDAPVKRSASVEPPSSPPQRAATSAPPAGADIPTLIERLADLRQKNVLTEDEFLAKKRELLSRL